MRRRSREPAFPIPLWASLLVGLLALTQSAATARLEALGGQLVSLPLRAVSGLQPRVVEGASRELLRDAARRAQSRLQARRDDAARRRPASLSPTLDAVPIAVVERRGSSPHGEGELVLDVARADLVDLEPYVTVGDELVGFLAERAVDGEDDPLRGLARVELLHHRERGRLPRRVPCVIRTASLAFLVEPAADVDRWPLRAVLLDDPYRAAALDGLDAEVHSSGLVDDPLGPLPAGLRIGHLRVFGYRGGDDRVLPIALHVEPLRRAGAIATVTLWRRSAGSAPTPALAIEAIAVRLLRLPVPAAGRERYLATSASLLTPLRRGAAVVDGERCLGTCEEAGLGYAIVAPFGQPGRRWSLCFVPDAGGAPIDFVARVRGREGARVNLAPVDATLPVGQGELHLVGISRDMPAALWLGRAEASADGDLVLEHDALDGVAQAKVLRGLDAREGPR